MTTASRFEFALRLLLCEACGAPIDAAPEGGTITCRYCKAVLQIAARVELPEFAPIATTALAEPERLARLAAQAERLLGQDAVVHPGLATVLEQDAVPSWRTQEAFIVWQSLRKRAPSEPVAADELSYLTGKLCVALDGEPEKQRALLESTLEAVVLPRHRQLELGALVDGAARAGDIDAAERWLLRCDSSLDDLAADSAYRVARALVATMRADWADVVAVLGARGADVPLEPSCLPLATLMRGNAHVQLGEETSARVVLTDVHPNLLAKHAQRFPKLFSSALLDRADQASRARALRHFGVSVLFAAIGGGLIAIAVAVSDGQSRPSALLLAPGAAILSLAGIAVFITLLGLVFGGPNKRS